ncbi:potassium channel family protein [Egicoccus halophilus]|uniref:Potassium channel domain-containing protein n=1 Tax=Egicoccus halophilus TaxID=1670830 RepID=A0A8J3AAS0_9ACTN|nr:potassium channel family protein [Egicoccus halophilus]GGI09421.1 hypothetical protein GCM10011354_33990 [Egicoccus halophilus]
MRYWLLVPGLLMVVVVFLDAFLTAVTAVHLGGPITKRVSLGLWRLGRRFARRPDSPLLLVVGPTVLLSMLITWAGGMWIGWTLVFAAGPEAVINVDRGEVADFWSVVYFAGYTVFTVGLGDYAPNGALWQVLTAVATSTGFVLLTMTVSFFIPVVSGVVKRRELASLSYGLGTDAQHMLCNAWDGQGFDELRPHLHQLAPQINVLAQQFLSYPVLHYFHSPHRHSAIEPGIAALDEALSLLEHGVAPSVRPHPMVLRPTRVALERFTDLVARDHGADATQAPPLPDLAPLRRAGIPTVDDDTFRAGMAGRAEERRLLLALVQGTSWRWNGDVVVASGSGSTPG